MNISANLLEAYRRVPLGDLCTLLMKLEDCLVQWESRVECEPRLRIEIRQGYETIDLINQCIQEHANYEFAVLH